METKNITLNEKRNVTLTAYLQDVGGGFEHVTRRPGIIVMPGGGYQFHAETEAEPVALAYLEAGYQAFILHYSLKEDSVWPNPLDDYEQAMEYIRSHSEEWHLYPDKIAVIGFSAGGHLAASAATLAKNRPAAAILGYAGLTADIRVCLPNAPDVSEAVDYQTCPCFLFATRTDNLLPINNTIRFMQALSDHGISFESHIYAYGPHGYSIGNSSVVSSDTKICSRVKNWVGDSIGWLKDVMGDFGPDGMTEPVCEAHVTRDGDKYLSADCTIGHLMKFPQAMAILGGIVAQLQTDKPDVSSMPKEGWDVSSIIQNMKLRNALDYLRLSEEQIRQVDEALSRIPNT